MDAVKRNIHKFGGSSLADATCYRRVLSIIETQTNTHDLIVVSASGKTTNQLLELLQLSQDGDQAASDRLIATYEFQANLIESLLTDNVKAQVLAQLSDDVQTIGLLLEGALDVYARNQILAHGELWSARLLSALLTQSNLPAACLDSRQFLLTELAAQPVVDEAVSCDRLAKLLLDVPQRGVVTGFIAADSEERTVTLGRNGSDYSATLLGLLVGADQTTIWSDVAGVFSADPRKVKDAVLQTKLSLDEAAELSRLGSPVLHARTLQPAAKSCQHVQLRCSYTPDEGSTQIYRRLPRGKGAKIVTSVDDLQLLDIQFNEDLVYQQNYAQLIDYLTSKQLAPICIKRRPGARIVRLGYTAEIIEYALEALKAYRLDTPQLTHIKLRTGLCMVALVGSGVTDNALQSHQFYQLISEHNLEFVQTGENKLSICAVIQQVMLEPLLKDLHNALFKQPKRVGVVLFGKGTIGSAWLSLFNEQSACLEAQHHVQVNLCGLYNSQGGVLDFNGLDVNSVLDDFSPQPFIWDNLFANLALHPFDELVIIDLTASDTVGLYYPEFAQHGFHVITSNKFTGAGTTEFYNRVKQGFIDHECQLLHSGTVAGGLPVQSSIRTLQNSGDRITGISGIFSGTLSWLFQQYDGTVPFSHLVEQAWQQGLTEPDPREDLAGIDVKRKLLILIREAGYTMDLDEIELESLVSEDLMSKDRADFLEHCEELDAKILRLFNKAKKQGLVLRYVANFTAKDGASIGLAFLEPDHTFANLLPCDNIFSLSSDWYRHNPMVIHGPGAGAVVTAGAVQADLLQLCHDFSR